MTNILSIREAITNGYMLYKYTFTDGTIEFVATNQSVTAFQIKDGILAISIDVSQKNFSYEKFFNKSVKFVENVTNQYLMI